MVCAPEFRYLKSELTTFMFYSQFSVRELPVVSDLQAVSTRWVPDLKLHVGKSYANPSLNLKLTLILTLTLTVST